jgi:flagellar basal-body rod modification protein FlgD
MTTIPATGNTTSSTSSSTTSSSSTATPTLGYNDFLQLLLAQMQNQDPLNPTDSTQYVSQLASFSNVEQGINMNSKLDQLLVDTNLTQASAIVGHTLTSSDGSTSGIVSSVRVDSSGATAVLQDGSNITIDAGVTVSS